MPDIPVSFDYNGKHYEGHLSPVNGRGAEIGTVFYLTIDRKHSGTFQKVTVCIPGRPHRDGEPVEYKWKFSSQTGEFEDQQTIDYFESVILAWYE